MTLLTTDLFHCFPCLVRFFKRSCTKEVNDILHPLQFGFRRKHSTQHTLLSMTEKSRKAIDNGNFGCGISIDLKKAFDTVNIAKKIRTLWYPRHTFKMI